ncbi:variable surface lipoprotein [Mycoplasmopsis adleri]|uniref:variable surface lipoprotein n=1 Tax=Mycoplasmopsis adleri TaxID=51362 RepID=UPI0038737256
MKKHKKLLLSLGLTSTLALPIVAAGCGHTDDNKSNSSTTTTTTTTENKELKSLTDEIKSVKEGLLAQLADAKYAALKTKLETAISAAQTVADKKDASKEELTKALSNLQTEVQNITQEKSKLDEVLQAKKELTDEIKNTREGLLPKLSDAKYAALKTKLETAISAAQTIADKQDASKEELTKALADLKEVVKQIKEELDSITLDDFKQIVESKDQVFRTGKNLADAYSKFKKFYEKTTKDLDLSNTAAVNEAIQKIETKFNECYTPSIFDEILSLFNKYYYFDNNDESTTKGTRVYFTKELNYAFGEEAEYKNLKEEYTMSYQTAIQSIEGKTILTFKLITILDESTKLTNFFKTKQCNEYTGAFAKRTELENELTRIKQYLNTLIDEDENPLLVEKKLEEQDFYKNFSNEIKTISENIAKEKVMNPDGKTLAGYKLKKTSQYEAEFNNVIKKTKEFDEELNNFQNSFLKDEVEKLSNEIENNVLNIKYYDEIVEKIRNKMAKTSLQNIKTTVANYKDQKAKGEAINYLETYKAMSSFYDNDWTKNNKQIQSTFRALQIKLLKEKITSLIAQLETTDKTKSEELKQKFETIQANEKKDTPKIGYMKLDKLVIYANQYLALLEEYSK